MGENITEDKRIKKISRQSKKVVYSTSVLKNEEKVKILLRELKDEDGRNTWNVVLKYTIAENIPQEVVIGTLIPTQGCKQQVLKLVDLIRAQLEKNADIKNDNSNYMKLAEYKRNNHIPFDFTREGIDILFCKSENNEVFERTVYDDGEGNLKTLISKEKMEAINKSKDDIIIGYLQREKKEEKWKQTKELILKKLSDEDRADFLKGEEIALLMQKTEDGNTLNGTSDDDISIKRNFITNYLLNAYDSKEGYDDAQAARLELFNIYIRLKEKGFATDASDAIQESKKVVYDRLVQENGEEEAKDSKILKKIDEYSQFFDIIKKGLDRNARMFALKIAKINFEVINKFFSIYKKDDEELLQYIEAKEEMINETQIDNITLEEDKYASVRKLYQFLLNAKVRDNIKEEEESLITLIFDQCKLDLLRENKKAIGTYNRYAFVHDRYVCPTASELEEKNVPGDDVQGDDEQGDEEK